MTTSVTYKNKGPNVVRVTRYNKTVGNDPVITEMSIDLAVGEAVDISVWANNYIKIVELGT